ncbi:MAG: hypothetical protein JST00_47625 [Deltaproteobacteria bacterium]|nr:hypothetical protein [Deltaproteobacteria bacterium]
MRRTAAVSLAMMAVLATSSVASADEPATPGPAPAPAPAPSAAPGVQPEEVDLEKDKASAALAAEQPGVEPLEAPPPPPYKSTLVIDTSLGALTFLGRFGDVAPTAPWMHTQIGYELFKWLMFFGEGELAFTDTSRAQDPPKTRAFPIFGFGGGARFTARFTDRFGMYLQGSVGLMKADVKTRALRLIGYGDAEDLGFYTGGRLGVEWYMLDRHFALGLHGGVRFATNFQRQIGDDTPLALDAGAHIRYAF